MPEGLKSKYVHVSPEDWLEQQYSLLHLPMGYVVDLLSSNWQVNRGYIYKALYYLEHQHRISKLDPENPPHSYLLTRDS